MEMQTNLSTPTETNMIFVPHPDNTEAVLTDYVSSVEAEAQSIVINNQADYDRAAVFGKTLKNASATVTEWFKPMKTAAYKAHAEIVSREKSMLEPLNKAEALLKRKVADYTIRLEQEKKALEAEVRRMAEEEANKKLALAAEHENAGNAQAAESALIDAQAMESYGKNPIIYSEPVKTEGVGTSKDWKIVSIDSSLVPIDISGIMLRPVDEKAIIRLIRNSKGTVSIPGVVYQEDIRVSIRK